jgi:transcription termination factor Rho
MAAEQQLERSVLERKEREELRTIAQAMALDTNSRTKKADIIDQILHATGSSAPTTTSSDGTATSGADGEAAPRVTRPRARRTTSASSDKVDANGTATLERGAEPSTNHTASANGAEQVAGAEPPARDAVVRPASGSPDSGASIEDRGSEGSGGVVAAGSDTATSSPPVSSPSSGGGQSTSFAQSSPRQPLQGGRPGGQNQGGQNQGGHQNQGQASNANDPAGRRSRRRRGRDRPERGPERPGQGGGERELQGGGQDSQYQGELVPVRGLLELRDEGYGFVRADGYLPSPRDVYVSISQARRFALRKGDFVEGACRPAASNEKFPALLRIDTVSGLSPDEARNRPRFEDLTPLFPDEKLRLETPGGAGDVTARIIDLLAPIGKGQRGLIVSPPKAGKTTVMKQIAHSIEANNPDVHLIVLLVDERPEEVTDMRRSVKGEVVASTFDRPADEHTAVSELTIDRAKRLVETGKDVVIILDGITRLARAYNISAPASGRIMSGGVDSGALYPPKKFFGAARNIEEGGSLTILATALVETGSKMDEVIFEEFKGTGNMELRLDRRLAERRLYPSIDVNSSSTRHEELLFDRGQLQQVWKLRRVLNALAADGSAAAGLELLMDKIRSTKSNDEFLAEIAKGPAPT